MTKLIKKLSEPRFLLLSGLTYTLIITVAFLYPAENVPQTNVPGLDKIMHATIHAMLSFIWLTFTFSSDKYHISIKLVFVVLVGCFLYGLIIEASQHWFTLSRVFDLFDILANTIGSLIGLFIFRVFKK